MKKAQQENSTIQSQQKQILFKSIIKFYQHIKKTPPVNLFLFIKQQTKNRRESFNHNF